MPYLAGARMLLHILIAVGVRMLQAVAFPDEEHANNKKMSAGRTTGTLFMQSRGPSVLQRCR